MAQLDPNNELDYLVLTRKNDLAYHPGPVSPPGFDHLRSLEAEPQLSREKVPHYFLHPLGTDLTTLIPEHHPDQSY